MTSRDFCFWLKGYIEIGHSQMHQHGLTHDQMDVVQRHLSLVFKHEIVPAMGDEKHQAELNSTHAPPYFSEPLIRC